MSIDPTERDALFVAGFALAEGIERASAQLALRATLVVQHASGMQCIPLTEGPGAMARASVLLHAVADSHPVAALLEEQVVAGQRSMQVSAWVDGEWRFQIDLPFRSGPRLHLQPERIWRGLRRKSDVPHALDALYSGVSTHPGGLRAWAAAEVEV